MLLFYPQDAIIVQMSLEKKHIITIAGKPASGKSTSAKLVAKSLGYAHYSTGDLFRELAAEQNKDVLQLNLHAERDTSIDHKVDERQKTLGLTEDNFVIDARLGWHFIPNSFKVYLDLDTLHGAERILANPDIERDSKEDIPQDPHEYSKVLTARLESESRRYKALYDADGHDRSNFDLVIDTKTNSPEQVSTLIIDAFTAWLAD
jgi:cytidylate kinase